MSRVVLDTNIVVSAFLFGGNPAKIIELAIEGKISSVTSAALLKELEGVLLEKFKVPYQMVSILVREWESVSLLVEPKTKLAVIRDDPSDNRVLECALSGKANFIVSGDSHLLKLREFRGIPIVTAQQFLADTSPSSF